MDKSQNTEAIGAKFDLSKLLKALAPKAIYLLGGYLSSLATLPFGSMPFGIALLCAANRDALFVYLGLALSCLFSFEGSVSVVLFGINTALLLLRALVRLTLDNPFSQREDKPTPKELLLSLFSEAVGYRVLLAAVGAFAMGACFAIGGGLLYYDIFGLLLSTAVAPLAAYIFSGFLCRRGVARELGFLALCAVCVFGALPLKLYGVSLAALGALWVTFAVSEKKGLGYGAITGLVLGLIYSPLLSPLFVLSALCVGIFMKLSCTLACFCAFTVSAAWGFYVKGIYALDGLFPAILSACLLYAVWHRLFSAKARTAEVKRSVECKVLKESELDGIRLFDMNRRMSAISDGLSSLSSFFEEIKLRYPKQAELMKICEDALRSSCSGCPMGDGCGEKGRIETEAGRLSSILRKHRGLSPLDFDRELISRCHRLPDILDEINYNSGVRISSDRGFDGNEEVFAPDYKALSRLLEKSMEEESDEYTVDRELSDALCAPLTELDLDIRGVLVYGRRRRTVYIRGRDLRSLEDNKGRIFDTLCRSLPFSIDEESLSVRRCSGEGAAISVCEKNRIAISYVSRQIKARGETRFCGDSLTAFENKDSRFFSLVSDGMGSGREAAAVSEICSRFMECMLTVGGMNKELLSMLGGFLSGRCEGSLCECSATVDLMELDLISGKTSFYKSGAAPTYIYRNGNLFKLRSRTMPIGILRDVETKKLDFTLARGDVVVMVSDGVTGGDEECPWLFDLLRQNIEGSGTERTAELVVKYAIGHGSEDDISVTVIRLEDAPQ